MAVVAGRIEVSRGEGGEVVARQEEIVVMEGEKAGEVRLERRERVLVAVPGEDGVAVAEAVRVQAVDVEVGEMPPPSPRPPPAPVAQAITTVAPRRAPRRTVLSDRTPLLPQNRAQPRKKKKHHIHLSGCIFCSLLHMLSGAALMGLGLVFLWPCPPLQNAALSIAAFGAVSVLVGITCCCFVFKIRSSLAVLLCLIVGALFLLALAAMAVETSYGLVNDHNFYKNHTNIDGCKRYDTNALLPTALVVASYVLLGLLLFYFIGTCFNALTAKDERPALYK